MYKKSYQNCIDLKLSRLFSLQQRFSSKFVLSYNFQFYLRVERVTLRRYSVISVDNAKPVTEMIELCIFEGTKDKDLFIYLPRVRSGTNLSIGFIFRSLI